MIVETNGTTDSAQLIESLALDPSLKKFSPPVQLSVIDGKRWQRRFWHNALEREQARTASHIHISRADSITAERLETVSESLQECGVRGKRTDPVSFSKDLARISETAEETPGHEHPAGCACGHHSQDAHGHDAHHFASCEILLPEILERKAFEALMEDLPEEVLRAKGLVVFADAPGEFFVFQKVGLDDETRLFPVGREPRVKTPLLLLIGPSLPVEALRERVAGLMASR
jgi:G3E family GTPase